MVATEHHLDLKIYCQSFQLKVYTTQWHCRQPEYFVPLGWHSLCFFDSDILSMVPVPRVASVKNIFINHISMAFTFMTYTKINVSIITFYQWSYSLFCLELRRANSTI